MWVPSCVLEDEAHRLFSGGPKWGALGGEQKVYVGKVYVRFLSLAMIGIGKRGLFIEILILEK